VNLVVYEARSCNPSLVILRVGTYGQGGLSRPASRPVRKSSQCCKKEEAVTASAKSLVIPLRSSVPGAGDSIQMSEIFRSATHGTRPDRAPHNGSGCFCCFLQRIISHRHLVPRGNPRPSMVRRSEKQRNDLLFLDVLCYFAAQNSHRKALSPTSPARQFKGSR
jgi:hypothetical protein